MWPWRVRAMKRPALMALALFLGAVGQALAGEVYTTINFSNQANFSWVSSGDLPDAPTGATTLGGVPFDIASNAAGYQAWYAYLQNPGNYPSPTTLTINTDVYGVTNVYTLINTAWGQPGPNSYAYLEFTGSGGAVYVENLVGNVDIRDWNPFIFTNSINNTTTINVFTETNIYGTIGRLDMQDITLPTLFASQTLTSIELVDNGGFYFQRTILDGVTAFGYLQNSAVPEPAALTLFVIGAGGGLGYAWRRRKRVA